MRPALATLRRCRPRVLTQLALAIVLALLVLSNLSFDKGSSGSFEHKSYGWPLIWHRYVTDGWRTVGWYWSASRLAGNLAMWVVMLAVTAGATESLTRRYRPQFRWGLRTMLAVVGLVAASCAWFAAARDRANLQDALIKELAGQDEVVAVERWGPKWLDLFGVDRIRRLIILARVDAIRWDMEPNQVETLLMRLSGLHELQSLDLRLSCLSPAVPAALSQLPQLKNLRISVGSPTPGGEQISQECLTAIGKMTQLEYLELSGMIVKSEGLACLGELASLRSLAITSAKTPDGEAPLLSSLPPLLRLDTLDLSYSQLGDHDLRRIAMLPRLTSLRVAGAVISDEGWAELSRLEFLEELEIGYANQEDADLAAQLARLLALDHLRVVHIQDLRPAVQGDYYGECELELDDRGILSVWDNDVERVRRALNALRESKPGIVIGVALNPPWWDWPEVSAWSDYDALPEHDPTWLPASDVPWMTAAERAEFEQQGGWARFDAAGWGTQCEGSASF